MGAGAVYAAGVSASNGNDAVLVKFDENGTLLWETTWGGPTSDAAFGAAIDVDGSAYITGSPGAAGGNVPNGSTIFSGNNESALVIIVR